MAIVMFTPGADRFSEIHALVDALSAWLARQPQQRPRPMKVELVENEDGSLSAITTAPLMELVK
jgi:hypothetical protein